MITFIYALKDPDTGEIRYIGKADNVKERLRRHVKQCNRELNHRSRWIRALLKNGKKPGVEIIDEVAQEYWPALEAAYIQFYLESGNDLVNGTAGGEGASGGPGNSFFGKKHTSETREKISIANRGRQLSKETRNRMSKARIGRPLSKPTRAKGQKRSPECCENIRLSWVRRKEKIANAANDK